MTTIERHHNLQSALACLIWLAIISLLILCATGCTVRDNVPVTKFNAVVGGKPCSFEGPKDFKAKKIEFSAETNGTVKLTLEDIDARMNPDVISMTGEAYAKMRASDAQALRDSVGLAKELAPVAAAVMKP